MTTVDRRTFLMQAGTGAGPNRGSRGQGRTAGDIQAGDIQDGKRAWRRVCRTAIAAAALLLTAVAPASAQSEEGKQAYSEGGCVMCHGPRGRGADGPRLVPLGRTSEGLARIVREGLGEMPPLDTDLLSDEGLDLIYEYLMALSGDTPAAGAATGGAGDPNDLLLRGIAAFVRPAELGGDLQAAERELRGAVDLLGQDSTLAGQQAEAYAWLGQVLSKMGRPDDAEEIYNLAIELRPDFLWVRDVLLPALQAK